MREQGTLVGEIVADRALRVEGDFTWDEGGGVCNLSLPCSGRYAIDLVHVGQDLADGTFLVTIQESDNPCNWTNGIPDSGPWITMDIQDSCLSVTTCRTDRETCDEAQRQGNDITATLVSSYEVLGCDYAVRMEATIVDADTIEGVQILESFDCDCTARYSWVAERR